MNIHDLIRSGLVRRWHANPDLAWTGETNGHHQWVVASLIAALNPNASAALLVEAIWHDVGEVMAGDLPAPFKAENPELAAAHAEFEHAQRKRICGQRYLSVTEHLWLVLADRLAAQLWMLAHRSDIAGRDGWPEARAQLLMTAHTLGCRDRVRDLMVRAEGAA